MLLFHTNKWFAASPFQFCNVQKRTNWFVFVATSFEILQPECFEEDKQNENIERRGHGKKKNLIDNQKIGKFSKQQLKKN